MHLAQEGPSVEKEERTRISACATWSHEDGASGVSVGLVHRAHVSTGERVASDEIS